MTPRERYRQLCEAEGAAVPLLQQHWWWEAVCHGKEWDVLLAERDGRIVGAMPYLKGRKALLRYSLMPQLTMYTGPWLRDPTDADTLHQLYNQLLAQHPLLYVGRLSPELTAAGHTAPQGFAAATHYTYRFDPIRPLPELLAHASQLRRRDNHRLSSLLSICTDVGAAEFAAFHKAYIASRGERDKLPTGLIERVCTAAAERGRGQIIGARSTDGTLQSALFVAYDEACAFMLMCARATSAPRNAMAYLLWQTIDRMRPLSRAFDFEGSMEPGVEDYYRSFGAQRTDMLQLSLCHIPFMKV